MRRRMLNICLVAAVVVGLGLPAHAQNPFIGGWDLTIPGGGAGWLEIKQEKGYLDGRILWGGGSVVPVSSVFVNDESTMLFVTRVRDVSRKDKSGKEVRKQQFTEFIMGRLTPEGGLKLTQMVPNRNGVGIKSNDFTAERTAPLPDKPDLSKIQYGKAIQLLDKNSLKGWTLTNPGAKNGWSVTDGVLVNKPVKKPGERAHYGNLKTVREFEDFNIKMDVVVQKGENSGVYLRGIYEIQVSDSFGRGVNSHNMGAVYSRITPTVSAEKAPGQWQTLDITLCDRHVTVILNGTTIIDNQPVLGCTGGALWSDTAKPGPFYLQGDHTGVSYKNIVLRPIKK